MFLDYYKCDGESFIKISESSHLVHDTNWPTMLFWNICGGHFNKINVLAYI